MITQSETRLVVLKQNVAVVGVVCVVLASLIGVAIGTTVIVSTRRGADVRSALSTPTSFAIDEVDSIVWSEGPQLLRSLEPMTIESVNVAWIRSNFALDRSATTGATDGIDTWFSGPARAHALAAVELAEAGPRWETHEITPTFYSVDGQILRLDINSAGVLDFGDAGSVAITESVRVVVVLRDGNWRIEHITGIAGS